MKKVISNKRCVISKKVSIILLLTVILVIFSSCSSNKTDIVETNIVKFGVISDIHGDIINLNFFVNEFKKENVDAILILGDTNTMFDNVGGNSDYEEMYIVFKTILADFKKPVFVIPGNHEPKEEYLTLKGNLEKEFPSQQFLLFDDTQRVITFKNVMLISVSGYHLKEYMHPLGGFLFNESFFDEIQTEMDVYEAVKEFDENKENKIKDKLLIAHGPPKGKNKDSIDAVFSGENVGNELINDFMVKNNIKFGAFGHIHEAGMKGVDENDKLVEENIRSDSLFLNPGSATKWKMNSYKNSDENINIGKESKGSAGILEIEIGKDKEGKARYRIITAK
ncbi:metallophosphoesterase [Candidatus Woesearchaeota archaeon]|nr:metallophosphoesterase [Candidatus Woesearchaeota archaeon]